MMGDGEAGGGQHIKTDGWTVSRNSLNFKKFMVIGHIHNYSAVCALF